MKEKSVSIILAVLAAFILTGCATMNCSSQNANGDGNKPTISTDAQATQDIKPNTSIPASLIP